MASIFDQYERANQTHLSNKADITNDLGTTTFINMKLQEDAPIFRKQTINFTPVHPITHVAVSNNHLVMVTADKTLKKFDLASADEPTDISLAAFASQAKILNLYLDPSGTHIFLMVATRDKETAVDFLYLNWQSIRVKQSNKAKAHIITSIAWNPFTCSKQNTGSILLATSRGLIFETEVASSDEKIFQGSLEQYWKQVYDSGLGEPIKGIEFFKLKGSEYCVIASMATKLLVFKGAIENVEDRYIFQNMVLHDKKDVSDASPISEFATYYLSHGRLGSFSWMTGSGVVFGNVTDEKDLDSTDSFLSSSKLIPYPVYERNHTSYYNRYYGPVSIKLTEFHVLIAYTDKVLALSVLNDELVFQEMFNEEHGKIVGLAKDCAKNTLWLYSEKAVFKYKITKESRDVWHIYMEKGLFDLAKKYCENDPISQNKVLIKEANHYFDKSMYDISAKLFAQSKASFESVCLKFLEMKDKGPLRVYLLEKLRSLSHQDKAQRTMLVLWIIELYLNTLSNIKENYSKTNVAYEEGKHEFESFLTIPVVRECCIENKSSVYELMTSHGDQDVILYFANFMKDFSRVIQYYIQENDYMKALNVLHKQSCDSLFYEYCPILIQHCPKEIVDLLIMQNKRLNPKYLIPTLVQNDENLLKYGKEIIRYVEFSIQSLGCKEESLHNYLLYLYAKLEPCRMLEYIHKQGYNPTYVSYNLQYALRLCQELNLNEQCVYLYSILGLYDHAIDLSLTFDTQLAIEIADKPQNEPELRKKMWLKIAKQVVEKEKDKSRAIEILQKCSLIKLEDILPFFPDFVTIDHFKDAICNALEEYNKHIDTLKEEMEEATKSADVIRNEIKFLRNKCSFISADENCSICDLNILSRMFYLFPCGHKFHSDCLLLALLPHLSSGTRHHLDDIQRQMASLSGREGTTSPSSDLSRSKLQQEFDDIIAGDCFLCGDIMIRLVDKPFIQDDEFEQMMKDWE